MVKRTKLKGVGEPPVLRALPPLPELFRDVSDADYRRLELARWLFKLSDEEILKCVRQGTETAPTLRLAAGGAS